MTRAKLDRFPRAGSMTRVTLSVFACIFLFFSAAAASEQIPAPPQSGPVALVGGVLHPVTGPEIQNGTILLDKGRIVALGRDVAIPQDAVRVDISGKHVWPVLIQAVSNLGLVEIGAVTPTVDAQEIGRINPNVRAERAINPDSERFPVTRANGVGLAACLPEGGLIPGQGALIQLDGWTWEDMTVKAPLCLLVEWPYMGGLSALADKKELQKRQAALDEQLRALEEAFREAGAYKTAREAAGKAGAPFHATDLRWEALLPVLSGELPVWVRANSLAQIQAAVEWAGRLNLKMVLLGGEEAPLAVDLLKAHDIPVIFEPVLRLPSRRDAAYDAPLTAPENLRRAGVRFCIAGNDGGYGNERNLPYHAAMAAAYGLPREEALKAVTLYPAQIMGVAERLGSLEPGKDASLIVTDGDPLEIGTPVEKMYLQGRAIGLGSRHKSLYSKYREKYRQKNGGK